MKFIYKSIFAQPEIIAEIKWRNDDGFIKIEREQWSVSHHKWFKKPEQRSHFFIKPFEWTLPSN